MPPTIGLFGPYGHAAVHRERAARIASIAEGLGYDSLWAPDHVVLPRPRVDPSPLDSDVPLLDPMVALAYLASRTDRIRLATGLINLPQRNPLVLAKELASVDVLSGGRLIFGLGVGYVAPELRAVGVPAEGRGARAEEYLQAMRALWESEEPAFHGRYTDFKGVDAHPRPTRRLPVVVGGHSPAAHRRAVRLADGWYGWMLGPDETAEQVTALRSAGVGRPLEISVSPDRRLGPEFVQRYAELGVDRLIVVPPPGLSFAQLERFVKRNAPERLGATPAPEL